MPHTAPNPSAPPPRTALAFLLAPGIAAAVGGAGAGLAALCAHPVYWEAVVGLPVLFGFFFALVGYPTAAVVGVPIYLLLPEWARRCFAVVVPLAGAVAAAPWVCLDQPWTRRGGDLAPVAAIAFALGAVAGVAFLFLRRAPSPNDGCELP